METKKSPSASPEFSVREFFQRFPNEEACLDHIMLVRFGGTRFDCKKCGVVGATHHRLAERRAYSCSHCGSHVYPTAGTILQDTRTPLVSWFYAMYLFCTTRHGVSGKELQRQLGVTYKTAWRMCNLIRKYMGYVDGDFPVGGHGKTVEIDETFIDGKDRAGHDDKAVVFGIVERNGDVLTRHVAMRTKAHIIPHVVTYVKPGSKNLYR